MLKDKIKSLNSSIYTKKYYLGHAKGFWNMLRKIKPYLHIKKDMHILDLGCGSGDLTLYLAAKGAKVIGIDYSKEGINLAKAKLKGKSNFIKDRVTFKRMDAFSMPFKENYFDYIISIDVFEHIYRKELDKIMQTVSFILKPGGSLFVHTEPNKIYLDYTHKYYIYPLSSLFIFVNRILTGKDYPNLSEDPRNELHKKQHVNEPTYFYLKDLFKRHNFEGKIISVGIYKPHLSWKDVLYNIVVLLYPFSLLPPLSWLFTYDYVCIVTNDK